MKGSDQRQVILTDQNVIRFNVRVHDVGFAQQTQSEEELVRICADGADV